MALPQANLDTIRKKVRRITRSPAESQLQTSELDEYINTFIAYDMPQRIQIDDLRKNFAIFTDPLQDRYNGDNVDVHLMSRDNTGFDGSLSWEDLFISVQNPVYVAGYPVYVTQSRHEFFNLYSQRQQVIDTTQRGSVGQQNFTGRIANVNSRDNVGLLRHYVTITAKRSNTESVTAYDDGDGNLIGDVDPVGANTINYATGDFDVTFSSSPQSGAKIEAQVVQINTGRPDTLLIFDNTFYLRPVPDRGYRVEFEAYVRPTALLQNMPQEVPTLAQWWQYIAYGAAKKVFEDRMDMESVSLIHPEFDNQERFVLRKTLEHQTKERTATIYAPQGDGHGYDNHYDGM